MLLDDILSRNGEGIALGLLRPMKDAVAELQHGLTLAGILDPPSDGVLGPVTHWALQAYCQRADVGYSGTLTQAIWSRLRDDARSPAFPCVQTPDLAGKIVKAAVSQGWFVNRHPECRNIFYIEGAELDGSPNDNSPNRFNDLRLVVSFGDTGQPYVLGKWQGTTEPGKYWTLNPMNTKGAARIAFGQYKSWSVGIHHINSATAHEALVQVAPITVFRDLNKDYSRKGDFPETGIFAVNQHWGYNNPSDDLGKSSAGCLVGRTKAGHIEFMSLCKNDPRYQANRAYNFMTGVAPVASLEG